MKSLVRRTVSRLAERRGYSILPTWRLEHLETSTFLGDVFRALDIRAVVDVGANLGPIAIFCANSCDSAAISCRSSPFHPSHNR